MPRICRRNGKLQADDCSRKAPIMADDTVVMPDSGTLSSADVPLDFPADSQQTAAANQKDGTGADAADSPKGNQSEPTSNPVLEKRLSDTESALKERQAELTRVNQAIAMLEGKIAATQNMMTRGDEAAVEPDPLSVLDDENTFLANPRETTKEALVRQNQRIASLLKERDSYWESKMQEMIATQLNPERMELQPVIAELSQQDWFKGMSPAQQLAAAKTFSGKAGNSGKPHNPSPQITPPLSSPAGTGRIANQPIDVEAARRKVAWDTMQAAFPSNENNAVIMPTLTENRKVRHAR